VTPVFPLPLAQVKVYRDCETLINNSVYLKNHITERKIVEKGKLKTPNLSGDEVEETGKIKKREEIVIRVGERLVRHDTKTWNFPSPRSQPPDPSTLNCLSHSVSSVSLRCQSPESRPSLLIKALRL